MSQTTAPLEIGIARAGLIGDLGPKSVRSYLAEGAVPYGRVLVHGTDAERQAKVLSNVADVFAGLSVHSHAIESKVDGLAAGYADKDAVSTLASGSAWVEYKDGEQPLVGDGLPVYGVVAAGADQGKVSNVITSNLAVPLKVLKADTANKLVLVTIETPS